MKKDDITKIIGYILITPALISVLLFVGQLLTKENLLINMTVGSSWTGNSFGDSYGHTSALPFYFGLMGIAGAYLIKEKK